MRRWPRRLLLAAVLVIPALEIAMQVGAWLVWRNSMLGPEGEPRPHVILLTGGSQVFEEGIDSVDQSWPAETAGLLRTQDQDAKLVNVGMRRSAFAVRVTALGEQLMSERPKFVVLGIHDDDLPRAGGSPLQVGNLPQRLLPFPWRWRTPTLFHRDANRSEQPFDERTLLGRWSAGGVEMRFEPEGIVRLGNEVGRWRIHEGQPQMMFGFTELMDITHVRDGMGERLSCRFISGKMTIVVERSRGFGGFLGSVDSVVADGRLAEARWLLNAAAAGPAPSAAAIASLVELDAIEGRFDSSQERLERLEQQAAESPLASLDLARAYLALGRCKEAVDAVLLSPGGLEGNELLLDRVGRMPDRGEFERLIAGIEGHGEVGASVVAKLRSAPFRVALEPEVRNALLADLGLALDIIAHFGATALVALEETPTTADPVWNEIRSACAGRVDVIELPTSRTGKVSVLYAELERRLWGGR